MATVELLNRILSHFPQRYLRLAFAYGSGVFQQKHHEDSSKNMIDFIFAVDHATEWHRQNMDMNSSHYSFLKIGGPYNVAQIQRKHGAKIYFNTLVPIEERLIKYGVISMTDLTNDLLDWDTLYVSGRLHKPVSMLKHVDSHPLLSALTVNHQSAVHAALLIEGEIVDEVDFYATIASFSYNGDVRMGIAEDQNKIMNIVKPSVERFREIYEPILKQDKEVHFNKSQGIIEHSCQFASRFHHLNMLPKTVLGNIVTYCNSDGRFRDIEEVLHNVSHDTDCNEIVQQAVTAIVEKSSMSQSTKGLFTAGVTKSVKYSWAKVWKMLKSHTRKP